VPLSTSGLLSKTFSIVMVADWPEGMSSSLWHEVKHRIEASNVLVFNKLYFIVVVFNTTKQKKLCPRGIAEL
jgi:hypothetical protein